MRIPPPYISLGNIRFRCVYKFADVQVSAISSYLFHHPGAGAMSGLLEPSHTSSQSQRAAVNPASSTKTHQDHLYQILMYNCFPIFLILLLFLNHILFFTSFTPRPSPNPLPQFCLDDLFFWDFFLYIRLLYQEIYLSYFTLR